MSFEVVVVGGGFAGLAAATALAAAGRRVLLLEARPSLGGRAAAFTDPATGERVDNGQHVLFGCYHETFRFLRRIGAEGGIHVQDSLAIDVVDPSGRASRLACPRLPAPFHLLAGVMTWPALDWRDRLSVLRLGVALSPLGTPGPAETVQQWLVRHRQAPRLIELLWAPLAVAALNQPVDVAAAAPFADVLRRMFTFDRRDAALAVPRLPLDELYTVPAADYLRRHHGSVRLNAVARIECGGRGGIAVRVRDEVIESRAVVCAVPWHALPAVFPDPPPAMHATLEAAQRTAASPIVTVNLWFDRRVTGAPFVGLPGRVMQWVFDKAELFGAGSSHLSLVSSGAAAIVAMSNQAIIDLAMAEITAAFPAAGGAVLQRAVVVREKRASFSVAPGQPARPATATAVPGLFLAGDWIDTGMPATIESAVLSGHRAAAAAGRFAAMTK